MHSALVVFPPMVLLARAMDEIGPSLLLSSCPDIQIERRVGDGNRLRPGASPLLLVKACLQVGRPQHSPLRAFVELAWPGLESSTAATLKWNVKQGERQETAAPRRAPTGPDASRPGLQSNTVQGC